MSRGGIIRKALKGAAKLLRREHQIHTNPGKYFDYHKRYAPSKSGSLGGARTRTTDRTREEALARYRYANTSKARPFEKTKKHIRYNEKRDSFRRNVLTGTVIPSSFAGVHVAHQEIKTSEKLIQARKHKAKAQSIRLKARNQRLGSLNPKRRKRRS